MKSHRNQQGFDPAAASSHLAANVRGITEYEDGGLPAADALLLEQHLQSCSECLAFYQSIHHLSTALEGGIKRPGLSASFTPRLWERIQQAATSQSEAACLAHKQRMQMEFEQYSRCLRKQFLRCPNLLDAISYGAAVLMGSYLLFAAFSWLTGVLAESWPALEEHRLLVFCGVMAIGSAILAFWLSINGQRLSPAEET